MLPVFPQSPFPVYSNYVHRENNYRPVIDGNQQLEQVHGFGFAAAGPFPYALPPNPGRPAELWSSDAWLQLPQANLVVNPKPDYITINSADRNRAKWPSTSNFCIKLIDDEPGQPNGVLGKRYRNIQSVKLLSASIPNVNGVLDEPYLLLQINEVEGMYDAPTRPQQNAFTKLYFKPALGKFLRMDKGVGDPLTRVYWPTPKATIDRFTVSFRTYDGDVFDFGADDGEELNPDLQTSITLEMRDYVPDSKSALGHRNI